MATGDSKIIVLKCNKCNNKQFSNIPFYISFDKFQKNKMKKLSKSYMCKEYLTILKLILST